MILTVWHHLADIILSKFQYIDVLCRDGVDVHSAGMLGVTFGVLFIISQC